MTNMLQGALNLRPGEGRKVAIMFLYSLFTVGGVFVIGRSISRALFLSSLPKEAITYRFILPPLAIILVTAVYTRLARRYTLTQLILGSTLLLLMGVLLFRVLLETAYGSSFSVLAALYVFFEVIVLLVGTQFWAFAGEVFDPRQAKRLFGLISAGGTIANVVGGAGLSLLASVLAPKNFVFILAGCLAGCFVCVWMLRHEPKPEPAGGSAVSSKTGDRPRQKSLLADLKTLGQSPLLVAISGMAIMLVVMATLAEYQLDLALKAAFTNDAGQISSFLGAFFFWSGLVACFIQFFVTGRVLSRFGITAALLFSPIVYAVGAGAILITGGVLWATALPRASDVMFRTTLNSAATNMLYLPAPTSLRQRAKTLVQGAITPPVIIALGLVFFFLRQVEAVTVWHWSIPMLLLVGLWIGLIFRARREYTRSLALNLTKARLTLDELLLDLNDETTIQVLIKTLQHADELQVIGALRLLAEAPQVDWLPYLTPLLQHPSVEVRITTLQVLARLGSQPDAELIKDLCHAPEEAIQAAAIEAYCTLNKEKSLAFVLPFLYQNSPGTKRAALVNLIRYGGLDGILPAVEQLKTMLSSDQTQIRLEAARALGTLQIQTFYQPLLTLFADPQPEVELEAIRSAGAIRAPELIPYLIPKLGQTATRRTASEALVQLGCAAEPFLAQTLADPAIEQGIRRQVPSVLQHIGSQEAAAILLSRLKESDRVVRGAVFASLTRLRDAGVAFEVKKDLIHEGLMLEFGYYYEVYVWRAELLAEDNQPESLLQEALTVRLNERLDRIFFLLELLHSVKTIDAIRTALKTKDNLKRANAIELLDNLIAREVKTLLLPLIEGPPEQVLEIAGQRFQIVRLSAAARLSELSGHADPWLSSCAIFEIGRRGLTDLVEPAIAALHSEHALVCETALLACRRLLPAEHFNQILKSQAAAIQFPQVRRYAQTLQQG